MVAPTEFDVNPNNNTTIGGLNIGEDCPAANVNDVIRYIAAVIRVTYNGIPSASQYVTATGGVFLSQPIYSGRGALVHNNDPAATSGRCFDVPDGTIPQGATNGDTIYGY